VTVVDLTVIVVTHQGGPMAVQTLRSARERLGALEAEWIVVDSGSTDGTPELIESELPDLHVRRLPNVGFAAGNNSALPDARGRYVLLLNPDMEIKDGTLADLVAALDERPEVGVASIVQLDEDGGVQETIRRFPSPGRQFGEALQITRLPGFSHLSEEERREARYWTEVSADWLVGGFLLVRREAVADAGGLDERFFLYSEETDWCYRLRAAGWEVRHLPVMTAVHHCGRMARPDLYAQNSHSKLLYATKHFSVGRAAAFRAALAVRHGLRLALLGTLAVARPALRERAAAERRALTVVLGLAPPPFAPVR
jgi:GT2 family glycosyltransferase